MNLTLVRFKQVWVMFYFGLGDGTQGHADILIAFSKDLIKWDKDEIPVSPCCATQATKYKQNASKTQAKHVAD